jgi:hypothetical protein
MRVSPVPPTPGSFKRRTEVPLTVTLPESKNSRTVSHPPPISPINRLRPGLLSSPNKPHRSPQNLATNEPATVNASSRRLKAPTPTPSRSVLRSPLSPAEDGPILSPRRARSGALSPEDGRPRSMATQELRELLENSPRGRRAMANVDVQPQTYGETQITRRNGSYSLLRRQRNLLRLPRANSSRTGPGFPNHQVRSFEPPPESTDAEF